MTQQFDLFFVNEAAPAKLTGASVVTHHSPTALSEEDIVRQLQATGRYRILKSLTPVLSRRPCGPDFP
ncbi:hypothetical protein O3W52_00640 [Ensifer psoraleae]|uniref:Uncharacterized protein n=1 Tax=Sinorhizobium psoraleae TaxID=520838 RepID=A0ABT4K9T5_9HYPH|nr:hypothetical protein [Sinorhizobium psoraleae]